MVSVIIVVFVIFVSSIVIEAFVLFHKRGCSSHKANGQNIDSTISQIMDQSVNDAENVYYIVMIMDQSHNDAENVNYNVI